MGIQMTKRHKCPRCGFTKAYAIRRDKKRCQRCKYEWHPGRLPLHLETSEWRGVVTTFLKGFSSSGIAYETGFERKRILRALLWIRKAMTLDVPKVFNGKIQINEAYLDGQSKNSAATQEPEDMKGHRGTLKTPVFGILYRNGKVWAEVVDDASAQALIPLINAKRKGTSSAFPDISKNYTGIAAKGCFYHFAKRESAEHRTVDAGNRISSIEGGFWGYLRRKLAAKGGVRKERLPLYLGEYVWRYNQRSLSIEDQTDRILALLHNQKSQKFATEH